MKKRVFFSIGPAKRQLSLAIRWVFGAIGLNGKVESTLTFVMPEEFFLWLKFFDEAGCGEMEIVCWGIGCRGDFKSEISDLKFQICARRQDVIARGAFHKTCKDDRSAMQVS
jgi:hypothetical protein